MPSYSRTPTASTGSRWFDEFVLNQAPPTQPAARPDFYDSAIRPALQGLRSAATYAYGEPDDPQAQVMNLMLPLAGGVGLRAARGAGRLTKNALNNFGQAMKDLGIGSAAYIARDLANERDRGK